MRCAALLLVALLVAVRAEGALRVEDEYKKALQDEERRTECEDCPCCPPPPARCTFLISSGYKYFYSVDGVKLKIEFGGTDVTLACAPGVTMESASLPVFPNLMGIMRVTLSSCPAPRASGGIRRLLSRLNINWELFSLHLTDVPPAPPLQPDLFAGLQHLTILQFSAEAGLELEAPPGLLEPLKGLWSLYLTNVTLSPAMLARLPPKLMNLELVQSLPAEGSAPAPRSTDLENVSLTYSQLQWLNVSSPRGTAALPADWLQVRGEARCPRLRQLRLYSCALGGLPADALRGLTELRDLTVIDCRELRALPRELFFDTKDLRRLVLAKNALEVLPDGIFAPLRELEELDLSGNMLGTLGDGAAALVGLRSLTSLQVLKLDHNPLGDTCGHSSRDATLTASELSPLRDLRKLQQLSLAHTGASQLCEDWGRDLHALKKIDFSYNDLTVLKYSDMQWHGRGREADRLELRLTGAHLASLPDALPASLRVLDLCNASLPAATERQVDALFADERYVLLEDARVACACAGGARSALALVLVERVPDVRCAEDGRRVREAPPCASWRASWRGAWEVVLGGLAVATLLLAGTWCAVRRGSRLRAACTRRNDDGDCTSVHYRSPE